ncbi:MAG: helicase-related protein [Bacteroidota bacterium]
MSKHTDQTFITNKDGVSLLDRFNHLIKGTKDFDVLTGYFYSSGFKALQESLEGTEKIRILMGIGTNQETFDLIDNTQKKVQHEFQFSHAKTKNLYSQQIVKELEKVEEQEDVEEGISKFKKWLQSGKLEIKAYPSKKLHAKLYIVTFKDSIDKGRVITGSSNFSQSGFVDNLEFNVELKDRQDYEFALNKFNELWQNAVDVSEEYVQTLEKNTWMNEAIKPYELYLKFLYEYFKGELSTSDDLLFKYKPEGFKQLEYQELAVLNAKKILEEYGGVFLSDVVGLGKTYMSAMLANQLDGRNLVIAPPVLLEKNNPGSWPNVFTDFKVPADFESIGKLDRLLEIGTDKYKNIFIDESHRFRNETNITYEKLARITRGKRVILVTATPLNNEPSDILSQIKLFQKAKRSTIPNLPDLESFFNSLQRRLKKLDRKKDREKYIQISKDNAREIRDKVLKYLMVRRTRNEIEEYFGDDLEKQGLRFPDVAEPAPLFYQLNDYEDELFNETASKIIKKLRYARYKPMLYYEGDLSQPEELAQKNMGSLMRIQLVKRLESSFYAFRNSIDRFIQSNERFLEEFQNGNVYISKDYINKIFELLESGNEEQIERYIEEDKATVYPADDFDEKLVKDLKHDISLLKDLRKKWGKVERDPKLLEFAEELRTDKQLKQNKVIVFTESKETANYLSKELKNRFEDGVIVYHGDSNKSTRKKVIRNFDANANQQEDNYRILITTEVLSEGVNLHRANVVVNYDIPWNPTRMMQRVGRINRVDTDFETIYTYNFFPSEQGNDLIKLKEAAESKISMFISLLGADAKLLTENESIESHELFDSLISKKTITGENGDEDSPLKYLEVIKEVRDEDPDLFDRIKKLPKKARTAREYDKNSNALLSYFRKGKLDKFYLSNGEETQELDFINAAKIMEVKAGEPKKKRGNDFYQYLESNKKAFRKATKEEDVKPKGKGGRDSATQLVKVIKALRKAKVFTDQQEEYLAQVMKELLEGGLPKQTSKTANNEVKEEMENGYKPLRLFEIIKKNIPVELLQHHRAEYDKEQNEPREVILSEYLISK